MKERKPYRFWTVSELRYLKKWYGIKPVREIAAHLGRTETATHTMADKHGVSGRGMRVDTKKHCRNQLRTLIMHGLSSYEIARVIKSDAAYVSLIVKRDLPELRDKLLENGKRAFWDSIKRRKAAARNHC